MESKYTILNHYGKKYRQIKVLKQVWHENVKVQHREYINNIVITKYGVRWVLGLLGDYLVSYINV